MIRLSENRVDTALAKLWANEPPTKMSGSVFITTAPVQIVVEPPFHFAPLGMTYLSPFQIFKAFVTSALQDGVDLLTIQRSITQKGGEFMSGHRWVMTFEADGADERLDAELHLPIIDELAQISMMVAQAHLIEVAKGAGLSCGSLTIHSTGASREDISFMRTPRLDEPTLPMFEAGMFRQFVNNASLVFEDDVMGIRDRWIRRVLIPMKNASDAIMAGPSHRSRALEHAKAIEDGPWKALNEDWIEAAAHRMSTGDEV